jgi:SAM-dependent methyltransferase
LHELGFREVCHVDLAPAAVQAVTSLRERSPHHRNLHSARLDVCDAAIPFDAPFDLIYLNGVVHHLRDPAAAFENLTACAAPRAILFFRIYRSGSLLFFTVDFLRRFLRYGDRASFAAAVTERAWIAGVPWMAMDMWDDFFVPVLGLYRADDVARHLRRRGWIPRLPLPSLPLDHSDPGGTPDSIALAFDRAPAARQECDEFPPSVDQLREVHRHGSDTMRATVAAMERALPALAAAPSPTRVAAAMDLYWIARRPAAESAGERHAALREILEPFAQTSESR